jgi:outer membrane lipoprotein-sorting protein
LVPVAAIAVVSGVGVFGPVVADASPNLPGITAQELLAKVQSAQVDGLSGTVQSTTDLGLPPLPDVGGSGSGTGAITGLLTGDHTARVAFAGPNKAKVSLLDNMAERVWTSDGTTAWAYDSRKHEAIKLNLPAGSTKPEEATPQKSYDPQAVAKQILAAIDPTTKVQVTGTEKVAGRDAYKLTLVPKTDRTTVGSVTLAVDSQNWVPLQVSVMPRTGTDPAVQLGFSAVSFKTPAASTFAFTPPTGTKVTDQKVPSRTPDSKATPPKNKHAQKPSGEKPTVIGTGWDSVVMLRGQAPSGSGPLDQLLANAPTVQGSWGTGKVLTSKMVSALITNDGRILVGLVPPNVLQSAAAKAPR